MLGKIKIDYFSLMSCNSATGLEWIRIQGVITTGGACNYEGFDVY